MESVEDTHAFEPLLKLGHAVRAAFVYVCARDAALLRALHGVVGKGRALSFFGVGHRARVELMLVLVLVEVGARGRREALFRGHVDDKRSGVVHDSCARRLPCL